VARAAVAKEREFAPSAPATEKAIRAEHWFVEPYNGRDDLSDPAAIAAKAEPCQCPECAGKDEWRGATTRHASYNCLRGRHTWLAEVGRSCARCGIGRIEGGGPYTPDWDETTEADDAKYRAKQVFHAEGLAKLPAQHYNDASCCFDLDDKPYEDAEKEIDE
jgi:hypothetical protein